MNFEKFFKLITILMPLLFISCKSEQIEKWSIHDLSRPKPRVVRPGQTNDAPPSDAIILFDGTDFDHWKNVAGSGPVQWIIKDDYMQVVPQTGDIETRQAFGSCQLHIEWRTPAEIKGTGQGRGNSGVFLMGRYEVQMLDSYNNQTYPDGQAGAIYGQKPPLVNACRKPGQWQSYDIIFHAPVFENDKIAKPARITVLHNKILIQDNWQIKGTTFHSKPPEYQTHPAKLPLRLQDHHNPMRFRNIWIRPLN
jgi:hypothetical protein